MKRSFQTRQTFIDPHLKVPNLVSVMSLPLISAFSLSLKPEQRRALAAYQSHRRDAFSLIQRPYLSKAELSQFVLTTGETTFFNFPIAARNLPSNGEWNWSQTRAQQEVVLPGTSETVKFWKVISRGEQSSPERSSPYKVWIFQVTSPLEAPFSAVWCETGQEKRLSALNEAFASSNPSPEPHYQQYPPLPPPTLYHNPQDCWEESFLEELNAILGP